MRKILGLPSTAIHVDFANPGSGICYGTGEEISGQDALLITLSGIAVECDYMPGLIDWKKSTTEDIADAKNILETNKMLCGINADTLDFFSPDEALKKWASRAARMLHPHKVDIARLAESVIVSSGNLNSEAVALLLDGVEEGFIPD